MSLRLPSFLIIGAMKSGTSSLHKYLAQHPEVFLPRTKELHFFDDQYHLGLGWYASKFSEAGTNLKLGEATPNYMHDPIAIERIADVIPDVQLLVILRNPVDRAYSHYWHNRVRGRESLSFSDAINAEQDRLRRSSHHRRHFSYVDRGRYNEQLMRIRNRLPRSQIFISLFDDLLNDPPSLFSELCNFLEVDKEFVPFQLGEPVNRFVGVRSLRAAQLSKRLPQSFGRVIDRLNIRNTEAMYEPLSAEIRIRLQEVFAEDISLTSRLIDRDLRPLWLS